MPSDRPVIYLEGIALDYREIKNLVFMEGQDRPDGGLYLEIVSPRGETVYFHAAEAHLGARNQRTANGTIQPRVVWFLEDVTSSNRHPAPPPQQAGIAGPPPEHANCRTADDDQVAGAVTRETDPDIDADLGEILDAVDARPRPDRAMWANLWNEAPTGTEAPGSRPPSPFPGGPE